MKGKDTKLGISHWNLPKKEEDDKNGGEVKETLKINVACLHLRFNYCLSIALEMQSCPKIRQT